MSRGRGPLSAGVRSRALMVLLAALVLWPAAVAAAPPLPLPTPIPGGPPPLPVTDPFIPSLGNQPNPAVGPCRFAALGMTEVRQIYSLASSGTGPGSSFGIDPANACHLFRSYSGTIDRSDTSGRPGWQHVFFDNSSQSKFSHGPFNLSPVYGSGGGPTVFYDTSGNNGVVYSANEGTGWEQRDTGLYASGVGPTGGITAFAVAPGNPNVMYLAGNIGGGQSVIYATTTGGQQWGIAGQPGPPITSISVDPSQPGHVLVAAGGPRTAAARAGLGTYYESNDAGRSWASRAGPPGELSPDEMLIAGPGRIYAKTGSQDTTTITGLTGQNFWRLDGSGAWQKIIIPRGLGLDTTLAYNPGNPNEMLIAAPAGNGVAFAGTLDGFSTTRYSKVIPTFNSVAAIEVRADRAGDFFVQSKGSNIDQLFALRVTALAPDAQADQSGGGNNHVDALKECHLAPVAGTAGTVPGQATAPVYEAGSIAFDGAYLDYTQEQLEPGVLHRMDPRTCTDKQTITLTSAEMGGKGVHALYSLTYDFRYAFANGHTGAILARGGFGAQHDPRIAAPYEAAIYAIDPLGGAAELAGTTTCNADEGDDRCDAEVANVFNYDHYLDALWVLVPTGPYNSPKVGLARLPPGGGARPLVPVSTCMTTYRSPDSVVNGDQAMWEPGAEGIMYIGLEDDKTVMRVNSQTCQTLDLWTHELYSEGTPSSHGDQSNEDDQMACDAITFGEGAPNTPPGTGTSVLWIRDNALNLARPYPIAKGFCPFPAQISLLNPPSNVHPGDTVTLCAVLSATTAGVHAPIANQTVQFSLGGHSLGTAVTDASGRACIQTAIPLLNGNLQLVANFAGTPAYLPATVGSSLRVGVDPPPPHNPPLTHNAPPAQVPPANVAVVPAPPPLVQASQAQAQAQSQAQAQAQAQSQPGVMSQKQRQARVNLARIDGAKHLADIEASRYHAALGAQGGGLALFGIGLFVRYRRNRRNRPQPAWISDRRHGPGRRDRP